MFVCAIHGKWREAPSQRPISCTKYNTHTTMIIKAPRILAYTLKKMLYMYVCRYIMNVNIWCIPVYNSLIYCCGSTPLWHHNVTHRRDGDLFTILMYCLFNIAVWWCYTAILIIIIIIIPFLNCAFVT